MTPEERETARQVRRDRRAAALREPPREQQADHQTIPPHMIPHAEPQPSNHSTLENNHPDVVQRMQNFHKSLSDLQNAFCDLCKEFFPTII